MCCLWTGFLAFPYPPVTDWGRGGFPVQGLFDFGLLFAKHLPNSRISPVVTIYDHLNGQRLCRDKKAEQLAEGEEDYWSASLSRCPSKHQFTCQAADPELFQNPGI